MYVDNAFVERRGRHWCHLLADSVEELHEFAASIGLSKHAFHRAARIPHYDITEPQRQLVLAKGVREVTVRQGVMIARSQASPKSRAAHAPILQQELFA